MYIADEVQTGLMRTGEMWAVTSYGVEPDILVSGKGISGGIYPIACVAARRACGAWLDEDGFGHVSTFGGAELGACSHEGAGDHQRPSVRSMVHAIAALFADGLRASGPATRIASSASGRTGW